MPRRATAALTVALALVLAIGCTDDEPERRATPTTTQPATTTEAATTTEPTDEAQLRQLAEDWYQLSREIYVDPERSTDELSAVLMGEYLTETARQVADFRRSGQSTQLASTSRHVVESVVLDGDAATVTECFVNGDVLLGEGGEVLDDSVSTRRYDTEAVRTDAGWRLAMRTQVGEDEEGDRCGG